MVVALHGKWRHNSKLGFNAHLTWSPLSDHAKWESGRSYCDVHREDRDEWLGHCISCQNVFDHLAMNVRKPEVASTIAVGKFLVV